MGASQFFLPPGEAGVEVLEVKQSPDVGVMEAFQELDMETKA